MDEDFVVATLISRVELLPRKSSGGRSTMKFPVAETFYSLQGEGLFTGTPMLFVRLAGCNVGKYEETPKEFYHNTVTTPDVALASLRALNPKHSICTTSDGSRFLCDTDYHKYEELDEEQVAERVIVSGARHMCITGGEPFLHNLAELTCRVPADVHVHIETSGTLLFKLHEWTRSKRYSVVWITCCPKQGFLEENAPRVDEWKFLVGPKFDVNEVKRLATLGRPVYLQPINGVNEVDEQALARVVELVKTFPQFRLSAQLHKFLKVR